MNKRDEEACNKWIMSEDKAGGLFENANNFSRDEHFAEHGFEAGIAHARKDIIKLMEALEFTLNAAEHLYKPDKFLAPDLPEHFYFTLSYEGDLRLVAKTIAARELLTELKEELNE